MLDTYVGVHLLLLWSQGSVELRLKLIKRRHVVVLEYLVEIWYHPLVLLIHGISGFLDIVLQERDVVLELESTIATRYVIWVED